MHQTILLSLSVGLAALSLRGPSLAAAPSASSPQAAPSSKRKAAPGKKAASSSKPKAAKPARPKGSAAKAAQGQVTSFEGEVLAARQGTFPEALLTVKITESGRPSILKGRGDSNRLRIRVSPQRTRTPQGKPLSAERMRQLVGAYYLLPGDRIRGDIRYTADGWMLESFERAAKEAPPKVPALRVELSTDKVRYSLGEDVSLQLKVTNLGAAPAMFAFPNGQRQEFVVKRNGQEVWRWSKGKALARTSSTLKLGPNDSMTFKETWPGVNNAGRPVPPGSYTASGWVTATGYPLLTESQAEIQLVAPEPVGPTVGDILQSPRRYLNKELTLEGVCRGHLADRDAPLVQGGPPTSRTDWILNDSTGSIYVADGGLLDWTQADINRRVRVKGLVRMNPEGRLYLRAWETERLPRR